VKEDNCKENNLLNIMVKVRKDKTFLISVLRIGPKALLIPGEHSTTWAMTLVPNTHFKIAGRSSIRYVFQT
jgi:hypothetical protein